MNDNSYKVMLVDDSSLARRAVLHALASEPRLEIVAEAKDGNDAMRQLEQACPDVVLLDIEMPGCNGIEFLTTVRQQHPARIVVFSDKVGPEMPITAEAMRILGAHGTVRKPLFSISKESETENVTLDRDTRAELINAIMAVLGDDGLMAPSSK